jgi:hypothetical protein
MLFRSAFLLVLFVLCQPLAGQDTIEAGVIKVRRPPIPAIYEVRTQYLFPPNSVRKSREANLERTAIVFSDSMKNVIQPQPFFLVMVPKIVGGFLDKMF